jgi:hypothetical protein
MKIKTLVELDDGTAEFTGKLSSDELQFVVDLGINVLLNRGVSVVSPNKTVVEGSEELQ